MPKSGVNIMVYVKPIFTGAHDYKQLTTTFTEHLTTVIAKHPKATDGNKVPNIDEEEQHK
jgi:hypothetical protein